MRLVLLVALSLVLAAASMPTIARAETGGLVILAPSNPHTLEFEADRTALVKITLRNSSDRVAVLNVALFDTGRNDTSIPPSTVVANGIAIRDYSALGELAVGQVKRLDVLLQAGSEADLTKVAGVLILGATDRSIPAATLNLVGAAGPSQFTGAKTQPTSVTMTVSRCWPSFIPIRDYCWIDELHPTASGSGTSSWYDLGPPRYELHVTGAQTEPLPGEKTTQLSSDTGGRLPLSLAQFSATGKRLTGIIRLGETDRAGKYTGKIALDAADEKAPTVDVTVNVQDVILWPLLVLIAGALIAYRIARWRDRERRRLVAERDVEGASARYIKLAECASTIERSWMRGLFEVDPAQPAKTPTVADTLETKLRSATTQVELDKAVDEVSELVLLLESWQPVRTAAERLRNKADEAKGINQIAQLLRRTDSLLAERAKGLRKSEEAKSFLVELNDQVAAIELVQTADRIASQSRRLWNELSDRDHSRLADKNPNVVWRSHVTPWNTRQQLVDAKALDALTESFRSILARVVANEQPVGHASAGREGAPVGQPLALNRHSATASERADAFESQLEAVQTITPIPWISAEAILARITLLDTLEFTVSAGIAVGVLLVALYVDKNFGTFWSYLGAFLAALSGTLVINWQLLPWYRKYTSVLTPKS